MRQLVGIGEGDPVPVKGKQPKLPKKVWNGASHLPIIKRSRGRCKVCSSSGVQSRSNVKCERCDLVLCLNKERNCFYLYHTLNYQGQRQMTEFSYVFRSSCKLLMNICCGHGNAMLLFYWRFWETVLITICSYWHFCDQYVFRTGITAILCERNQKIASVCTPVLLSCHSHSKNLLFQFGCWQAQGP